MSQLHQPTSRREFLQTTGKIAAASALAGMAIPKVYAGENNTLQIALVGSGDRGSGAVVNALKTQQEQGPIKLVAMADVFPQRLTKSFNALKEVVADQMDVAEDRKFLGFDAYQKAMDSLNPGDIVVLATPPAFRWVHFTYAIQKGLNVFMEKPVTVDGPTSKKMLDLAEQSAKKNLKVGVGLMCRHCKARGELYDRIKDGQIGDILLMRAYRMHGPLGSAFVAPKSGDMSELLFQVQRFHGFLWASGGLYSDFYIHNIDECCWMKDAWPVEAQALGGRNYRGINIDQNFDNYSVEYTFADGTKMLLDGRCMPGCHDEFASYAHGSKGFAVISTSSHAPAKCRIFKGQKIHKPDLVWRFKQPEPSPYQLEWDDLIHAIRSDRPFNEVKRGVQASLVTSMGRMAAHTGRIVTYDQMLNCPHEFGPGIDKLAMNSPAPLLAGPDGKYPVPQPGVKTDREY